MMLPIRPAGMKCYLSDQKGPWPQRSGATSQHAESEQQKARAHAPVASITFPAISLYTLPTCPGEILADVTGIARVLRQRVAHRRNRRLHGRRRLRARHLHDPTQLAEEGLLILNDRPLPERPCPGPTVTAPSAATLLAQKVAGAIHHGITSEDDPLLRQHAIPSPLVARAAVPFQRLGIAPSETTKPWCRRRTDQLLSFARHWAPSGREEYRQSHRPCPGGS
jgi:hypothetical protein